MGAFYFVKSEGVEYNHSMDDKFKGNQGPLYTKWVQGPPTEKAPEKPSSETVGTDLKQERSVHEPTGGEGKQDNAEDSLSPEQNAQIESFATEIRRWLVICKSPKFTKGKAYTPPNPHELRIGEFVNIELLQSSPAYKKAVVEKWEELGKDIQEVRTSVVNKYKRLMDLNEAQKKVNEQYFKQATARQRREEIQTEIDFLSREDSSIKEEGTVTIKAIDKFRDRIDNILDTKK